VQFSVTPLRPGFSSYLKLYCKNNSAFSVNNASLSVLLPNLVQYDGASVMPNLILGDTYTWNLATLIPGEIKIIEVTITTPVGTPLGTSVNVSATILPITNDENPTNNVYERQYVVTGAFDPNDKLVHPPFVTPGMLQNGAPFEYTIRFQNTGTAPATFVRLVDTLNALLSPETFRFVASSHPCTWSIKDRGVVDIFFDDIQLPDSTSNEPASHGFARFTILPRSNLPLGTIVPNFCDIYFDYNEPVRTNTAGTQVVYFLPGQGLLEQPSLLFKPNPAAIATRAHWKIPAPADGRIRLFDARGLPQLEMPVIAGQTSTMIPLEQLHPGLYFVVLESGALMLSNKLVVINLVGLNSNN
jgi:uncharacterized repeat protein (TIGR01451 family)